MVTSSRPRRSVSNVSLWAKEPGVVTERQRATSELAADPRPVTGVPKERDLRGLAGDEEVPEVAVPGFDPEPSLQSGAQLSLRGEGARFPAGGLRV
jgi:hypothetical protein